MQKPVLIAHIGRTHGIKGEVKVKTFTSSPMALMDYGALYDQKGKIYRVESVRAHKAAVPKEGAAEEVVVVRFSGVHDCGQAALLNGTQLFVDRAQLPDIEEEDLFYQEDLRGFVVLDLKGKKIGNILAFFNFGGGDLIEISLTENKSAFIPFSKGAIPTIDKVNQCIWIDPVAAGLADLDDQTELE